METSIIMLIVGLFFLLIGFIIWKFKIAGIVAGYDRDKITDPDALASWIGKCLMGTGLSAILIAFLNYEFLSERSETVSTISFMIISMMTGVLALAGTQKYQK